MPETFVAGIFYKFDMEHVQLRYFKAHQKPYEQLSEPPLSSELCPATPFYYQPNHFFRRVDHDCIGNL